jgi:hypothetical protein
MTGHATRLARSAIGTRTHHQLPGETAMSGKPAEVKKLESGQIAVRWEGQKKFNIIDDEAIAQYLIFWMIKGEGHESGMLRAV